MTTYRVGSIMRTGGPEFSPGTPIRRAVAMIVEARAAAAAVVAEDQMLVGILTQKDCFRPTLHASYYREWTGQVADHMSREVVCVGVQDDVTGTAEMFLAHPHRVFPVKDGHKVVGMLHRSDVLELLVRIG